MTVAPHATTYDAVTAHYVEECENRGPLSTASAELELPRAYREAFDELRLARPLFAEHGEITRFADDLTALFDLLASLPEKCFGGDVGRYCEALGMDERLADLMRIGATGPLELYGRADAYHDGTSFKLLEFNVGSELGGVDTAQMNRAFLDVPSFRAFATRHRLAFVDTAAILAERLLAAARPVASGEPVVALLEGPGGLSEHRAVFDAVREALRRHGIHLLLGEVQQLTSRKGKLVLDGSSLDVVLRYFTAAQLLEYPAGRDDLRAIVKAHEEDRTALFTPLAHGLIESKANLALLHDPRLRQDLTGAEVALVDRIVPWTRTVGAGSGTTRERAALIEECRARRESLILKPGTGWGGAGALLGRELTDRQWSDALHEIRQQDYVVQEIVTPVPEPVFDPVAGELEAWQANWGIFATGEGYAGAFCRALRIDDGSVISFSHPETRGACVFTYQGASHD